jgi:hypothetical protein
VTFRISRHPPPGLAGTAPEARPHARRAASVPRPTGCVDQRASIHTSWSAARALFLTSAFVLRVGAQGPRLRPTHSPATFPGQEVLNASCQSFPHHAGGGHSPSVLRANVHELTRQGLIPHRRLPGSRRCLFREDELESWECGAPLEMVALERGGRLVRPTTPQPETQQARRGAGDSHSSSW